MRPKFCVDIPGSEKIIHTPGCRFEQKYSFFYPKRRGLVLILQHGHVNIFHQFHTANCLCKI